MDFLIENNYLSLLNKLKLVTYFNEYIYILKDEKVDKTSKYVYEITEYFKSKYNLTLEVRYKSKDIDRLSICELMQIYIDEYCNVSNIVDLLESDRYHYSIDIPNWLLEKWEVRLPSHSGDANAYFNLVYNLHEQKIYYCNSNIKYDLIAINYLKYNEFSLEIFHSYCINSDIIQNKIRTEFDISFFIRNLYKSI